MRSLRKLTPLPLILGVALAACQQQAAETGEMEETPADTVATVSDADQLQTLKDDYVRAWEAHDVDTMLAMMTPGYHEVGPEGSFDYAGAEAMMRDPEYTPPTGSTMEIEMQTIEVAESGDVAYASGTSTVTVPAGENNEAMTQSADWVAGFKKIDGAWKIDRLAMGPLAGATADDGEGAMDGDGTGEM
jgi:uncharacterized protein (TIGR02246 family)